MSNHPKKLPDKDESTYLVVNILNNELLYFSLLDELFLYALHSHRALLAIGVKYTGGTLKINKLFKL